MSINLILESFSPLLICTQTMICIGSVAPARGARGAVAPPMLKKMAFVILPNSMRKLGRGWVSISDVKKS